MAAITVVVGAQFGSEGKGAIAAHLTKDYGRHDVAVRVAGPNAGHTAYDSDGREWKLRAVPVAAVTSRTCQLHIAAGSEVDPDVLFDEIQRLDKAGHGVTGRLTVHPSATMIERKHLNDEASLGLVGRIGSTGKGIGAARSARIMREARTFEHYAQDQLGFGASSHLLSAHGPFDLADLGRVLVEGTQGYGLGLHTEFYPHVTSSDCRAIDFLAMAGIFPWSTYGGGFRIVVVARMNPIRVAGNSGPLEGETTWEALGLPEERTTVTNKVRRVGAWDSELVHNAIAANGGGDYSPVVELALTMWDHHRPEEYGKTRLNAESLSDLSAMEDTFETNIRLVGTSPTTVAEVNLL